MVMSTTRLIGTDTGGYPSQPDADAIVRLVDNELISAMDLNVPILTLCGGPNQFTVNAFKHSWVENDLWRRRITTWSSIANDSITNITITGQAHRYPVGSIFAIEDELMRVTAIVDANNLTVTRGYAGSTPAAHTTTTKPIILAGASMHENDNWVYKPTSVVSLPFNYCQLDHSAVRNSWRRQATNLYGITGAQDLDTATADMLAQKIVAIEGMLINGLRFVGSASEPATAGGFVYYITSANGAYVSDKSGATLQEADIYTMINTIVGVSGVENVARTLVMDQWAYRKVESWYRGSRRLSQDEKVGGSNIDTLRTPWGDFKLLMHYSLPPGNMYLINTNNIKVGNYGAVGAPHVGETMEREGPFSGRYVYMDVTTKIKNVPTMGRIHNYSLTT